MVLGLAVTFAVFEVKGRVAWSQMFPTYVRLLNHNIEIIIKVNLFLYSNLKIHNNSY